MKSVWKDYPDIKNELMRLERRAADMLQLDSGPQDLNPAPGVVVTRTTSPQVDNILTVKAGETRLVTRQKELFACSTWEYVTNGQESALAKRFEGRDWNDDHVVSDKAYEYHPGLGTITVHES